MIKYFNCHISKKIKDRALELGFLACGISKAEPLTDEREILKNYLHNGYHGKMNYMQNHFEKRLNPMLLHEGTKSVISVLYSYFTNEKQLDKNAPVLSKYAFGQDYHQIVKGKLKILADFIRNISGNLNGRVFVDSAPVLERAWAQKSGIGWIGKNGNLINKNFGSFFFIGELFVDLDLEYDESPAKNYCGQCTRCIDSCPTKAIVSPGVVDGRRCISYLTIELKDDIPEEFKPVMQNRVFGCDICQDVCPFNKKAKRHTEPAFKPLQKLMQMSENEWDNLDEARFKKLFRHSPVNRAKYKGLRRNLDFLKKSI